MSTLAPSVLARVSFLCLLLALPAAASADTVIDSFQTAFNPNPMWVGTNGTAQQGAQQQNQGQRSATLSPTLMSNYVTASISPSYTRLSYRTRDLASSGTLNLTYGQFTSLDLNLSGSNRFRIAIANLQGALMVPVTIGVTCKAGNFVQKTYNLGAGENLVRFSDFTGCDFSNVSRVVYFFNGTNVNRLSFDLNGGLKTVYDSGCH